VPPATTLKQAAAALARRDRSTAALVAYLEERGVDADEAAEAVERLRLAGYVDEGRLATLRAEEMARRGYGDAAIRADLGRRDVGREHIDDAVSSLDPERERVEALVDRDGRTPKIARRLLAKGFAAETVAEVMRDEA
jgi:SOS response regulatory protein OraA/RecX